MGNRERKCNWDAAAGLFPDQTGHWGRCSQSGLHGQLRKVLLLAVALLCGRPAHSQSNDLLRQAGLRGGLAVEVGANGSANAVAFADSGTFLYQALSTDRGTVEKVREDLAGGGLYGIASIRHVGDYSFLPYADGLVNLLICDLDALGASSGKGPSEAEMQRVLAYHGVSLVKSGGTWKRHVKPLSDKVDEWSHPVHGPERNPVSSDQLAQPFTGLKWSSGPDIRNYALGARIEGGVIYVMAEENKASRKSYLTARDAFSGVLLWKIPVKMGAYHTGMGSFEGSGAFVAANGKVYLYPGGAGSPLHVYEGRTGRLLRTFEDGARVVLPRGYELYEGQVTVAGGKVVQNYLNKIWVFDEATGKLLWQYAEPDTNRYLVSPVVADGRIILTVTARKPSKIEIGYLLKYLDKIKAFALETGKPLWENRDFESDSIGHTFFNIAGYANGYQLTQFFRGRIKKGEGWYIGAIRASDGKLLWRKKAGGPNLQKVNSFIVGDKAYVTWVTGGTVFDVATGEQKARLDIVQWNCNYNIATPTHLMWGPVFCAFKDITFTGPSVPTTRKYLRNHSVRTACGEAIVPAYGQFYSVSNSCGCEHFMPALNAVYAAGGFEEIPAARRLEKGPVSALATPVRRTIAKGPVAADWVHALRTGVNGKSFQPIWTAYSKEVGPPATSGATTLQAFVNEHRVEATRNGGVAWNFFADGRVEDSLLVDDGLAYAASHDGRVYAIRIADGTLAWRFFAAPADRQIVAFGQLESVWPVLGMLLKDNTLFVSAGRHPDMDSGLYVYALDKASGAAKWRVRLFRHPETEKTPKSPNRTINTRLKWEEGKLRFAGLSTSDKASIDPEAPGDIVLYGDALPTALPARRGEIAGSVNPRLSERLTIGKDALVVTLPLPGAFELALYDMAGKKVFSVTSFANNRAIIDRTRFGGLEGRYAAALRTPEGTEVSSLILGAE